MHTNPYFMAIVACEIIRGCSCTIGSRYRDSPRFCPSMSQSFPTRRWSTAFVTRATYSPLPTERGRLQHAAQLREIDWVRQTWLGIKEQDPVARLARRWSIYLERSLQVPDVHFVRYEDFCEDKLATILWLAEAVGVDIDENRVAQKRIVRQASQLFAITHPISTRPGRTAHGSVNRTFVLSKRFAVRRWNFGIIGYPASKPTEPLSFDKTQKADPIAVG